MPFIMPVDGSDACTVRKHRRHYQHLLEYASYAPLALSVEAAEMQRASGLTSSISVIIHLG